MKATFQLQKPDVWTWRSRLWRLRWWRLHWWRLRWWRLCWWRLRRHRFELLLLFGCHQALQPLYSLYSFTCRQGKGIPFWYATVAFEQLPFAPVAFEPYLGQKKERERERHIYIVYMCVCLIEQGVASTSIKPFHFVRFKGRNLEFDIPYNYHIYMEVFVKLRGLPRKVPMPVLSTNMRIPKPSYPVLPGIVTLNIFGTS